MTIKKISKKNLIIISLWILTFILLLIFVILAATIDQVKNPNVNAATGFVFTVSLFTSILVTVFIKYFENKKEKNAK